jgi:exodeoxyribonuclease V alpha subunit
MSFEAVVEVKSTFPSPLGGAIFKGIPVGERKKISFRASRWRIPRIPAPGEYWKVKGRQVGRNKHGDVVVVASAYLNELPGYMYVAKLLKNHPAFRGFHFGPSKIDDLIENVKDFELVDLLNKGNYLALAKTGLNENIAQELCNAWLSLKEETELATFLVEHKLEVSLVQKILRVCKYDIVARLKRNPYSLIALSNTTKRHLQTIKRVAMKLGIDVNDPRAVIGCVEYALYTELDKGNTIVQLDCAIELVRDTLDIINSNIKPKDAISMALSAKAICVMESKGERYLQTISVAYIEQYLEDMLVKINNTPLVKEQVNFNEKLLREELEEYNQELFKTNEYRLSATQDNAVIMALTNRLSTLSGFGGTGKTTVLKAIAHLANLHAIPVHVAALAGKAANRASQSIERDAHTIHSVINSIKFKTGLIDIHSDPMLIIDESSMLDLSLMCTLLRQFKNLPVRLVFVGDTAQLPPIGFGLFYHRLVESNVKQVRLTEVYRQIEGSPLHDAAMNIRNGQTHDLPVYKGQKSGVYLFDCEGYPAKAAIKLRKEMECMILTPYSNGRYKESTASLNQSLQYIFNEPTENKLSLSIGYSNETIGINEPVLVTKNCRELGIFNGMTGVVQNIKVVNNNVTCEIKFEGMNELLKMTKDQCWQAGLQLGYALTIHKAQGSEYDACVIVLGSSIIENSALYTALTRTKRLCILVGTQQMYDEALQRPPRYTTIQCGFNPSF